MPETDDLPKYVPETEVPPMNPFSDPVVPIDPFSDPIVEDCVVEVRIAKVPASAIQNAARRASRVTFSANFSGGMYANSFGFEDSRANTNRLGTTSTF